MAIPGIYEHLGHTGGTYHATKPRPESFTIDELKPMN